MLDDTYDVFISYSSRDATWVRGELLPRLERHGLRVCIDYRDFEIGVPSVEEMQRAVQRSQHTLLVLTPNYVNSAWTKFETLMLQTLDPANRKRRLIPLLKTACDLPLRLQPFTHVDFRDEPQWTRLLNTLGTPAAKQTPDAMPLDVVPGHAALPPGSLMPLSTNPLFVGRERELRDLARLLKGGATAAINPLAAATGLGGIGKTQLASEFLHRYGQFYPGGVFWLSFENAEAVPAEIARCGGAGHLDLRPNFASLPLDDQIRLVQAAWQLDLPRLLVFDNCEDEALLDQWRPKSGGCRVLVTSRRAAWSKTLGVQTLKLETLPRAESIALLRKHRPDLAADDHALDALADYLGDLPLALHVAGSYLALYQDDLTAEEYLSELQAADGFDAELLAGEDGYATGHDQSVLRTFRLSYDKLDPAKPRDALALRLLHRAAYCAPGEPLPRELLIAITGIDPADKKAIRPVTPALRRLSDLGLLEIEESGALRLHRLLAAFVRAVAADEEAQGDVEQTLLETANRLNKAGDPRPLLLLQAQLRAVTDAAYRRQDERAAGLCNTLGYHLKMIGDYRGPQRYFERALAINEAMLGTEHPDTATSLNNLGNLLQTQDDYARARLYLERALAIREAMLGAEHPDTAQSLDNLGALLQAQGDYARARPYHERALAIYEAVLGPEHPDTAQSLNNLGGLLQAQDDYAGARSYYERALAIWEAMLGPELPTTAQSLNNLGALLQAQGDYVGARPYYEQALAIIERVLNHDHPTTQLIRSNLAALDAPPQSAEQQIAEIERQAAAMVEATLTAGDAEHRTALAAAIEERAQWVEKDEPEDSPYLALAERLRVLAARLNEAQ